MTLQPVLPWWLMATLMAVVLVFLARRLLTAWRLLRASRERSAPGSGDGGRFREWLFRSALVLLLLAAAFRPGVPGGSAEAATADANVFFVVDTSSSMVAEDYADHSPRLEGVRQDIMAVAGELAGARFSLLTFDSNAVVRMPLTTDTSALDTAVAVLQPRVTAFYKGSSITAAGKLLTERLRSARDSHPERPRLVYYLGDGEQTSPTAPEGSPRSSCAERSPAATTPRRAPRRRARRRSAGRRAACGAATARATSAPAAATASPPCAAPPGTSRIAATAR